MTEEILQFGLQRENEERRDGGFAIILDPKEQKFAAYKISGTNKLGFYGGGFDKNEDEEIGTFREVQEESGLTEFSYIEKIGKAEVHYFNSLKKVNRVALAACFIAVLKNTTIGQTHLEDHEKFELVWVTPDQLITAWKNYSENQDYDHWIYFLEKAVERLKGLGYYTE